MPELARRVVALPVVQVVLELGVALAQPRVELDLVPHRVEVERLPGAEDDGLLGEVPVRGIV